jgi:hypothetical protein
MVPKSAFYRRCVAPIQSGKTIIDCHSAAFAVFFQDVATGMAHCLAPNQAHVAEQTAAIIAPCNRSR